MMVMELVVDFGTLVHQSPPELFLRVRFASA